jgi:hypothetical protein
MPGLHQNGTRIVWESLSTSDGAQSYWSFYDTLLDAPCAAGTASDGKLRCLPLTYAAPDSGYYADSSCSTPLATDSGGCMSAPSTYAIDPLSHDVYPLTGAFTGTVYSGTPASCSVVAATAGPVYSVGAVLAPSSLVAVTKLSPGQAPVPAPGDVDQNGTRIQFRALVTADGASAPDWMYDSQVGQVCSFSMGTDGQERCFPPIDHLYGYYADASCATPVYGTPPSLSVGYVEDFDEQTCSVSSYYAVGAPYTGTVYANASGPCSIIGNSSNVFYSLSPFAVTGFATATVTADAGPYTGMKSGTRIQFSTATSGDGARSDTGWWHDTLLGVDCFFNVALDGVLRCLPADMVGIEGYFYADASCTTPLVEGDACSPAPMYAAPAQGCTGSYYRVGALHTAAPYVKQSTGCHATTLPSDPVYDLGAAVPASTFAAGTLSH